MNWLEKWIARRRVKALKSKISEMKQDAKAAQEDQLALSAATITHRIELLEKAVEKIEASANPSHSSDSSS